MTNETNPATGVFDKVAGKVKQVAGTVLGNEDLKEEGRLHEVKADAESQAAAKAAEAEQREEEAEVAAKQQELVAERQRLVAEEAADAEAERIERARVAAEAKVEVEHTQREASLERQEQAQEQAVDAVEAQAVRERLTAEKEAARIERQADDARKTAEALDTATRQSS